MKLGEIFYELGFQADNTKFNDFLKMVGELDMKSVMGAAGFGALADKIRDAVENTKEASMDLYRFGIVTGMNEQKLDSWAKAAKQAGLEGDTLKQTLSGLQQQQLRARQFGASQDVQQAIYMLQNLGKGDLSRAYMMDDAFTFYEKVQKAINGVNPALQRQIVELMGINEQNLIFMKNQEKFSERNSQAIISRETEMAMRDLNASWAKLNQELSIVGAKFATEIAPAMIKTAQAISTVLRDIEGNSFFQMLGKIGSKIGQGLGKISDLAEIGYTYTKVADDYLWRQSLERRAEMTGAPRVNATFHFSHVMSPEEIQKHTMYALSEAVREAKTQLPPKGY